MATGTRIEINGTGIKEVSELLQKFGGSGGNRDIMTSLHQAWSIEGVKWIDQNFTQQGALTGTPWAALKPSTIAGRRKGKGSGSARILQNNGFLRQSFYKPQYNESEARVGSPLFYSQYHEEGRGPWTIRRKSKITARLNFPIYSKHPGLPQRRMLPRTTDTNFMDRLKAAANYLLNKLSNGK